MNANRRRKLLTISKKLSKLQEKISELSSKLNKCIEEEKTGNKEFGSAKSAVYEKLTGMDLPEVRVFLQDFIEGYKKTLDELR